MRTSEFREAIGELGFTVDDNCDYGFNIDNERDTIACVSNRVEYNIDTDWFDFEETELIKRGKLLPILVNYASTPIAEREEEKRYRLKLVNKTVDDNASYLNKIESEGKYFVSNKFSIFGKVESIFTESELKKMDLTGFEKVEVTE